MKEVGILLHCLIILNIASFGKTPRVDSCIVRNDNDYVTFYDAESAIEANPLVVKKKFSEVLTKVRFEDQSGTAICYKITGNDTLIIFILSVNSIFGKEAYIVCYNPYREIATKMPVSVNLRSAFNNEEGFKNKLLTYPLALLKDGNKLYLKERVHNGNIYDAVITKVYSIGSDMSLSLAYCFESCTYLSEDAELIRVVTGDTILTYEKTPSSYTYLGKSIVDFKGKKVIRKECDNNSLCSYLFSASGESNDDLFRSGYPFSY